MDLLLLLSIGLLGLSIAFTIIGFIYRGFSTESDNTYRVFFWVGVALIISSFLFFVGSFLRN